MRRQFRLGIVLILLSLAACQPGLVGGPADLPLPERAFPVTPELFNDQFDASEGITFNGQGQLFVGANRAIWRLEPDGTATRLVEVSTNLGQAGIGERDILAADFGPKNIFRDGPNDDGVIWRVTPEGEKTVFATGIADPNFILGMPDGSFLVSDDGTDELYHLARDGTVTVWSRAIDYANGLALSLDGSTLYVAQIFTALNPPVLTDKVWALPVRDGKPAGTPELVVETGGAGGVDGLAMDQAGRVYIAENAAGKIWRYDPASDERVLIAEGIPHVASLVFGEGDFDSEALYATTTFRGSGKIWKIPVGARGIRQVR